jgi:ABC-type nitrate/sulfonate/bicarbonate transport system substrate-binding protein
MTRELAARGAVGTAGELGVKSLPATGPDPRETFATLDTAGAAARPTWIHAGTQRAEAGFQDPALGWVGVRADTSGGGVHAELVAGSADAAQALGGHIAGLNAYLAEHHTPVETLTLTAPEGGWAGLGSDRGTGEGMQQGAGQQTGQGTNAGFQSGTSGSPTIPAAATSELPVWSAGWDGSVQESRPVGGHISVMA